MSDFLYTSGDIPENRAKHILSAFVTRKNTPVREYRGPWGTLAVADNHYRGYNAYENDRILAIVIGGPVPLFPYDGADKNTTCDNELTANIVRNWLDDKTIRWDDDLAGPFCILAMDKNTGTVTLVTDLCASVPVYYSSHSRNGVTVVGSHVDAAALLAERNDDLDNISLADFIANGTTTFPYTVYNEVTQLPPASIITLHPRAPFEAEAYWTPAEPVAPPPFEEAVDNLRKSIRTAAERLCRGRSTIGLLLSGGEDSRAIIACLPPEMKVHAFIFLDVYNREGKTARKIADLYGVPLTVCLRTLTHYLDDFPERVRLMGSQNECIVPGSGFYEEYAFNGFDAFIDGWWSDSILKGYWIPLKRHTFRGVPYLPPERIRACNGSPVESFYDLPDSMQSSLIMTRKGSKISMDIFDAVRERRKKRIEDIRAIRPQSAGEWINLWPLSQNHGANNLIGHRRLFRHYSLFMDPAIIKIGVDAPEEYKLNRRLFHAAAKDLFRKSRFVPHVNGTFPYYGAITNIPLSLGVNVYRKILKVIGVDTIVNHGPLPDWPLVVKTDVMKRLVSEAQSQFGDIERLFAIETYDDLFGNNAVDWLEQVRIVQMLLLRKVVTEIKTNV